MEKRRYSQGTLYFFPAFLPLAELLPWMLTFLAGVAGVAGFSFPAFWKKYRRAICVFILLCVSLMIGLFFYQRPSAAVRQAGTALVPAQQQPVPAPAGNVSAFQPEWRRSFGEIWSHPVEHRILSTPVISGDLLVFGTLDKTVEAVARKDGAAVWTLPVENPVLVLTKGENGIIYSAEGFHDTAAASLTAVDGSTGSVLWQRQFLGHLEEMVTLDPATRRLWTSTGPGGLWGVNMDDGSVLWQAAIGHTDSRALYADGVLYLPADVDEAVHKTVFFALEADSGKELWRLSLPGQPWGSPLLDKSGKILLTSTGAGQIGVERKSDQGWAQGISTAGKLVWQISLPGMPIQPASYIAAEDIIIHTTKNGYLTALRGSDGTVVWQVKAGDEFQANATLLAGFSPPLLASTTYGGMLSIRNALTGEELARRLVGGKVIGSPVGDGDILYVPGSHSITAFGGLHALENTP